MSEQIPLSRQYMIDVHEPNGNGGALVFSFVPKGLMQERGLGGAPKRVPHFSVAVRQEAGGLAFDWTGTEDDPGAVRHEMQSEIAIRIKDREIWIERVTILVGQVEQWAREMGWSSRRVGKKLEDAWIGKHEVPALVMQEDTCRIILEPVGRSTPGTEGVVDLYLMPAYDDIASLYYYGDRWNLHYMFPGAKSMTPVREVEAVPLSKQTFESVLAELRKHAA